MPQKDPCSKLAATVTKLALNIGERPGMDTIQKVVAELQKDIPQLTRAEVVSSIVEATTGYERAASEVSDRLNALKREARSEVGIRAKIAEIEKNLKAGTLPASADRPDRATEAIKGLRELRAEAQAKLRQSEPAKMERVLKSIDDLTERLDNGVFVPKTKMREPAVSKELDRKLYERDQLKAKIRRMIEDEKPKSWWNRYGSEALNLHRAVFTSLDVSAIARQGGWIGFGHPAQHVRVMRESLASMKSPEAAHRINQEILNRPNAPLYKRAKLYIAPENGGVAGSEEAFMSRLVSKIPGISATERQYVTFLNVLRADMFDTMVSTLARNGEVTLAEAQHIANYINISTGRGSLGYKGLDHAADALATTFFSPRYMASRIQLLAGQPFWGAGRGSLRTQAMIAKEYARSMAGIGAVIGLGLMAGGQVETDPRSSDFLKLRFGNMRVDLTSGLSQYVTLGARLGTQQTKDRKGKITKVEPESVAARFIRGKFAPIPGAAANVIAGKDMTGEKTSALKEVGKLAIPITPRDIYQAFRDDGVPDATAQSLLNLFGFSANSYK